MESVTISPKYQIVIPAKIRKELDLKPGQKVAIQRDGKQLKLTPVPTIEEMFGIAKGIDTSGLREKEDRM
jgi:AbrB family looped-hinge helix DNA binding protein